MYYVSEVMKMYEKIKVSVPARIYALLRKDAEDFRIVKPSGEANLNALINALMVNFHRDFAADEDELREKIKGALAELPPKQAQAALEQITQAIAGRERSLHEDGQSIPLSFKPTKATERVAVYIENVLLKNESLSSFYRRMFVAYAQKTKNEREKLIHREVYDRLIEALERGVQVCISLENGRIYNDLSLYSVSPARDELFNYALFYGGGKNITVRLAKIKTVSLLAEGSSIPPQSARLFARQVSCGAQYPVYSTDDKPIRVRLTEKGRALFNKIYLYRPTPVSVEGDVYTFDCSQSQALYYFERFGAEALILSPKKLGIFMRNYYYYALKKYRTLYSED